MTKQAFQQDEKLREIEQSINQHFAPELMFRGFPKEEYRKIRKDLAQAICNEYRLIPLSSKPEDVVEVDVEKVLEILDKDSNYVSDKTLRSLAETIAKSNVLRFK